MDCLRNRQQGPTDPEGQRDSLEFRFLDATANVYLFMAALLAAGTDALAMPGTNGALSNGTVRDFTKLREIVAQMSDCQVVPSALSDEDAREQLLKYGVTERMPRSLKESLDAVRDDADMKKWLGEDLLTQYVRVKEKEVEYFAQMGRSRDASSCYSISSLGLPIASI